jgi:VanZ family protein
LKKALSIAARDELLVAPRKETFIELRFAAITAGVVALIVYGSLFPFEFYLRGSIVDALQYFFSTTTRWWDPGDALSNILLYIPLGLFGSRALRRLPAAARIPALTLAGAVLSATMEVTQYFDVSRAPELGDLSANTLGTLLGAASESLLRAEFLPWIEWRPFAILLVVTEFGMWLFPFAPRLNLSRFLRALEAMRTAAPFEALAISKQILFWLVLALLIEALVGTQASRKVLAPIALATLAIRFIFFSWLLARADLIGAFIGVAAWILFVWRMRARVAWIAALFAIFVVVDALRPFTFGAPRDFGLTPFLSFINGPRGLGSRTFLEKTFTYGALLWLLARARNSLLQATAGALALVVPVRIAQIWLPGRSAEITDAIMVLILAAVMKALPDDKPVV